ncbi:hypothetical protein GJ744_007394 [Endocarpon pusillum]|uniref:Uncharacterized protein n=1 Tax=Endocarpon pusillum TaxID=364733 RepID=A0A8H7AIT6_9EURO|nr:hypothetical protein GJ744_007394 [Endocarpon pusillum]
MNRGICVRSNDVDKICYQTLEASLKHLGQLRLAEYTGAASVLALLPTIGALFGAPTTEIWRLLTIVPLGVVLQWHSPLGGAILPVHVEDYEDDTETDKRAIIKNARFHAKRPRKTGDTAKETYPKQQVHEIMARIRQAESKRLAKGHLWLGLLAMIILFVGAQAAMIIVEQGGVLPWWCISRWWMHLWYLLVTSTAIAENWAQLPFKENWKLFVSDIPYDISVRDGEDALSKFGKEDITGHQVLHQLASLRAGAVTFHGSNQFTRPRNVVLVIVSVTNQGRNRVRQLLRLLCKCTSIATFVTGTALFASVQLLALPMAVMTLTLILAAGVFGRAIIGWIVSGVDRTEPLIHLIADTTQEAQKIIAQILSLGDGGGQDTNGNEVRNIQVELAGHIFISQRRVASRSPWYRRTFGVLAEPFDLRKLGVPQNTSPMSEITAV